MSNIDTYERNLQRRLNELKTNRDPAYELHEQAITEAILYSHYIHGYEHEPRVLDCGCGLGFLTEHLSEHFKTDGIDPSKKSIELAEEEHPGATFYNCNAETFPQIMRDKEIPLYDQAILNMVLHSVDDNTVLNILNGLRACLRPEGTVIIVIPGDDWIQKKLIEYEQDMNTPKGEGLRRIEEQLQESTIPLHYKISNGDYYPEPLTFYNRNLKDYGELLYKAGYGVKIGYYSENGDLLRSIIRPFERISTEYTSNNLLGYGTNRELIISYALID